MIQLTDEYKEAAKRFKKKFRYGVPLSMIPPVIETPDLIKRINECIESGKDDLLESFGVKIDDGQLF